MNPLDIRAKKKYLFFAIIIIFLCVFIQNHTVAAAGTPYSINGQLSISKGKVVNSKGKPFVMKGVSTHGLSWYPEYVNEKSFKTLRDSFGVNTIRLAMYTAEYNGYCTGNKSNRAKLEKLIDQGVKSATKLGMYVIIDWHILSDGSPKTYQSQANTFFKNTAKKYAGYKNVMYEICNEPNGGGGSWKNIKSYASVILKTIRSVNKKAIIIIGTPTWSQDVDTAMSSPITGYQNIAYSFHFYAGTHRANMRTKLESVLKKKFPVIVTEFGISDASGNGGVYTSEGNQWIALLNKYQVGRVCWNLSNKNESSSLIKSSCSKTSGWKKSDLSSSGTWLLKTYTGKSTITTSSTSTAKTTATPTPTPKPSTVSAASGSAKASLSVVKVNSWKEGSSYCTQYKAIIKNTGSKTLSSWTASVTLSKACTLSSFWCSSIKKKGNTITLTPLSWNKRLTAKQTTEIGFIVKSSKAEAISSKKITVK